MIALKHLQPVRFAVLVSLGLVVSCAPLSTSRCGAGGLADVEDLPAVKELPDPFRFLDGSRVETRADWEKRRQEMKTIIEHYGYGHMPPAPTNVVAEKLSSKPVYDGAAREEHILLSMDSLKHQLWQ